MTETAVLIAAAGASKRMGFPKQLLSWNETTLLKDTIRKIESLQNAIIIVVLGSSFEAVSDSISDCNVKIVRNLDWESGLGNSISKGVQYLQKKHPEVTKVVVTLADLPLIEASHYQMLLETLDATNGDLVASKFDSIIGVPAVFTKNYFDKLAALTGEKGAKKIIEEAGTAVQLVPYGSRFMDIDTPEAYEKLLGEFQQKKQTP